MKYLLILIVLAVALQVWRSRRRQNLRQQLHDEHVRTPVTLAVACAHCGIHVPQVEGFYHQGQWYCCQSHAQAHANRSH